MAGVDGRYGRRAGVVGGGMRGASVVEGGRLIDEEVTLWHDANQYRPAPGSGGAACPSRCWRPHRPHRPPIPWGPQRLLGGVELPLRDLAPIRRRRPYLP